MRGLGKHGGFVSTNILTVVAVLILLFCAGAWVHNRQVEKTQAARQIQAEEVLREIATCKEQLAQIAEAEASDARRERAEAVSRNPKSFAQPQTTVVERAGSSEGDKPAAATAKPGKRARRENMPLREDREVTKAAQAERAEAPEHAQRAAVVASGGRHATGGASRMIAGIRNSHERRLEGALSEIK